MNDVLALIPARAGSKGIPNKNFTMLEGQAPIDRAMRVAEAAGVRHIVLSSDRDFSAWTQTKATGERLTYLHRPAELADGDTPMIDVVKHALAEIPGPSDQIVLLIQPTQPLRQPKHLRAAIDLLESSGADSVVSVVELPLDQSPDMLGQILEDGSITPWMSDKEWGCSSWPATRQRARPAVKRDGTCYAFYRATVERYGTIYGKTIRPLVIDPSETAPLDTPEDWQNAERRLRARD